MKSKSFRLNYKTLVALPIALCNMAFGATYTVTAGSASDLQNKMKNAVAGDIIQVPGGTYAPANATNSGDPGNNPNGTGLFYVKNNGSSTAPIIIIGDPANKPILKGTGVNDLNYVIHVNGTYVYLKNLKVQDAGKGIVYDNASNGIIEDCIVNNVGSEGIHFRDASSNMTLSRTQISNTGMGTNCDGGSSGCSSYGEGLYLGTDYARWGADDVPQTAGARVAQWGPEAISEGYGGYDWRITGTKIECNYFYGISAEPMDVKEGTQNTTIKNNHISGDYIHRRSGAQSYDDSFVDLKGVKATATGNKLCLCGNPTTISKYFSEVQRDYNNVPIALTTEKHSSTWTDDKVADLNDATAANNSIVTSLAAPTYSSCTQYVNTTYGGTTAPPPPPPPAGTIPAAGATNLRFQNKTNSKCLTVTGTTNSSVATTATCGTATSNKVNIVAHSTSGYEVINIVNSGRAIDAPATATAGTNMTIYSTSTTQANRRMDLIAGQTGYFMVKAITTGLCAQADATNVTWRTCSSTNNAQNWKTY